MPEYHSVVVPPDGGWGWFVVIVAFISNFYEDGIITAFGLFMGEIAQDFGCEQSEVAVGSSVLTGLLYILGPVICALINRYGLRFVAVLGGFLAGLAMATTSLAPNVSLFIASYGLFSGIGFCMTYMTNVIAVGFYFQRKRAFALSIAVCGSSVGTLVTPIILSCMSDLTWRRKFQILSGGGLIVGLLGFVFKPIEPTIIYSADTKSNLAGPSVGRKSVTFSNNNRDLPTVRDHVGTNYTVMDHTNESMDTISTFTSTRTFRSYLPNDSSYVSTRMEILDNTPNKCQTCCYNCHRTSEAKPMNRDDIFLLGVHPNLSTINLQALSDTEYFQKLVDINVSLTRVPNDEKPRCGGCCHASLTRMLSTMCDVHLLQSLPFLLLALSGFVVYLGFYVPYTYCFEFALYEGVDEEHAVYLVSTLGITNTLGRFFSGTLTLIPRMDPITIFASWLFFAGASIVLMPFLTQPFFIFFLHASFGFFIASISSLRPLVAAQLVGLENLTNAFGILLLFSGIAALVALPLAGKLAELTGNYTVAFVVAGTFVLMGSFLMMPMKRVARWQKARQERKRMQTESRTRALRS